jgi:hypothetical protein
MGVLRAGPLWRGAGLHLITPIDQNVTHMGAVGGAQFQRHHTGGLQSWLGKALGQCQQAQTRPVAMLGVMSCFQQARHQGTSGHANAVAPVDESLRRPLQVSPVGSRQMLRHSGEPTLVRTAQVKRHALAPGAATPPCVP